MHFDSQTVLRGLLRKKRLLFLVLKQKIYVIYTFKIYSGYKCFKIIKICTNLKYVFLFWQDELITDKL